MNEREWFERMYQEHADMLFRLARHLLQGGDDSAVYDLLQDTFLDAWTKRTVLTAHPNIGGWLALSVKNRAAAMAHKERRRGLRHAYSLDEEEARPAVCAAMTPEQETLLQERAAALRELLGEENAALFLAYTVEGCSAKELGRQLGLSEDCIWMRISRMKRKLVAHPEIFYAALLMLSGMY